MGPNEPEVNRKRTESKPEVGQKWNARDLQAQGTCTLQFENPCMKPYNVLLTQNITVSLICHTILTNIFMNFRAIHKKPAKIIIWIICTPSTLNRFMT